MKTSSIKTVFLKEAREMMRDKRVRSSAFFGPIFLIFMMMSLFGVIFSSIGKKENQRVHVVRTDNPNAALIRGAGIQVTEVANRAEGEKLIRDGKARVLLEFGPTRADGQTQVEAFVDPKSQTGQITLSVVRGVYDALNKQRLAGTLRSNGIPESATESIKLVRKEVQVGAKGGPSEFLLGMLPYLIVIWAFYGAMNIASDLVAGEKEKNTLETLLISPASRTQIVLGKFLALGALSLASSLSSLLGLVLVAIVKIPGTAEMFKTGLGVTPMAAGLIVLLMIPMAALFSSILIALSSYARNPREAQTYLTQVSFVVILPAVFSQVIGLTDAANAFWVNYIPILNTANNIRLALLGKSNAMAVAVTVAISLVLALIALRATVRFFNREEVLVRV